MPATEAAHVGVYALRCATGKAHYGPYIYSVRVSLRFGQLYWQACSELPTLLFALPDGSFRVAERPDEPIRFSGDTVESVEADGRFEGPRVADDQFCAVR